MCTLSYVLEKQGYRIFFNRDELRARQRALPPRVFTRGESSILMPSDPDGGGTWMGMHSSGFFVCLLNNYPAGQILHSTSRASGLRSRGLLLRALLESTESPLPDIIERECKNYRYAPFYLAVFWRLTEAFWGWDGQNLQNITENFGNQMGMLSSSSFEPQKIPAKRLERFRYLPHIDANSLRTFHWQKNKAQPSEGVLMSRKDAKTVSVSEIELGHTCGWLRYWDIYEELPSRTAIPSSTYQLQWDSGRQKRVLGFMVLNE